MVCEDILSTEDYELCSKLKAMRFSGMAEALEELLRDPNADLIPFREKVGRLVDAEWDLRYNKKLNRFMKKPFSNILMRIWMRRSMIRKDGWIPELLRSFPNASGWSRDGI